MPWATPALRDVRGFVRDSIRAYLPGSDAAVPNSVLRVLSDVQGGLCHMTLQYVDWLSLQLLPDTAETEWLDRHGEIWLVNSDGTVGRKSATLADGTVTVTGVGGAILPMAQQMTSGAIVYETTEQITIAANAPTAVAVRAITPGTVGNQVEGASLSLLNQPVSVDTIATVIVLDNGTDTETDDQLRARILQRIRNPPMGGAVADYEAWALAVPGVTRAWAAPEQGVGTITVRFLMDDLRASDDGWPTPADVQTVADYIDSKRPVTVKDCYVLAPIKEFIDITIANLVPNTTEAQAEIEASIEAMLFRAGRARADDLCGVGVLRDHECAERAVVPAGNDRRLCDAKSRQHGGVGNDPLPMSDRHIRRSGQDYAQQFLALLPDGQAWPRHPLEYAGPHLRRAVRLLGFCRRPRGRLVGDRKRSANNRRTVAGLGTQLGTARPLLHGAADHRPAPARARHADDDARRAVARVLYRRGRDARLLDHHHRVSHIRCRPRSRRGCPRLRCRRRA